MFGFSFVVSVGDSFEEAKRNKNNKNKMQKVDPNLLGFQCNAAPELMNRAGEMESMAETLGKGKKWGGGWIRMVSIRFDGVSGCVVVVHTYMVYVDL